MIFYLKSDFQTVWVGIFIFYLRLALKTLHFIQSRCFFNSLVKRKIVFNNKLCVVTDTKHFVMKLNY